MTPTLPADSLEKLDEMSLILIMVTCHKGGNLEKRDRARSILLSKGVEVPEIFNQHAKEV